MVAVDILGLLTVEDLAALGPWIEDGAEPTPRPGAAAVFQAYRERGYELLYITAIPPGSFSEGSVKEVATEWLADNELPTGPRTQVWVWHGVPQPEGQTWIAISDELLSLSAQGVSVDAAYSGNSDKAYAFAAGGVAPERNFTLSPGAASGEQAPTSAPTTLIPDDDMVAHAATIRELPPVCQVG